MLPSIVFKVTVHATGELRAGRTITLVTPPVGGALRIVRMQTTGMTVAAGDVVVEFDPADQEYALHQARSELAEAGQEIVKMRADSEVLEFTGCELEHVAVAGDLSR